MIATTKQGRLSGLGMSLILLLTGGAGTAGPVLAQEARPEATAMPQAPSQAACTAQAGLAAPFASWSSRRALAAAGSLEDLGTARLTLGTAVDAQLLPTGAVRYPLRPEKPGGSVSHGGLFSFHVASPGRYRVALGSAAWIDVVGGGQALVSVAHGHGPACSGIRKIVDFTLAPGDYTLQVSANAEATMGLLVTPVS